MIKDLDSLVSHWRRLRPLNLLELTATRDELHRAIQLVAMVGRSILPRSRRDENAVLEWIDTEEILAGRPFGEDKRFRIAISIKEFKLILLAADLKAVTSFDLENKTQSETFSWLSEQIEPLFDLPVFLSPDLPYELPQLGDELGRKFKKPTQIALEELSNYFHNFNGALEHHCLQSSEAGEILCWPRFFDLSAELILLEDKKGIALKTCAIGMSTGDAIYHEPYMYLNLIPAPSVALESLGDPYRESIWQTGEWFGMILPINRISKMSSKTEQAMFSHNFLRETWKSFQTL